jgi:hypothetical protein
MFHGPKTFPLQNILNIEAYFAPSKVFRIPTFSCPSTLQYRIVHHLEDTNLFLILEVYRQFQFWPLKNQYTVNYCSGRSICDSLLLNRPAKCLNFTALPAENLDGNIRPCIQLLEKPFHKDSFFDGSFPTTKIGAYIPPDRYFDNFTAILIG